MIASSDEDEEKTSRCGLSAFNTATYTSLLSGNEPYFLLEDSGSHPASPMLLWWVMVRTFSGGAYQWRLGRVESLVPQVINLDEDRTAPSSANEPNVVVDFESGCERLSLRVDNFSDGDDDGGDEGDGRGGHSLCWFRIEETATVERDRRRKALRARKALEDRTGRRRQVERGCGQCGFRAVMRQLLATQGVHLNTRDTAVSKKRIEECRQIIGQTLMAKAGELAESYGGYKRDCSPAQVKAMGEQMMEADGGSFDDTGHTQHPPPPPPPPPPRLLC